MKHMKNPVTGEVVLATPLTAKKLQRYGWTYVDQKAWVEYKRSIVELGIARHITGARLSVH